MLIDIPIKSFLYRFASLTWGEELGMQVGEKEDGRRVYLSYALREISGLKINSVSEARMIIDHLPTPAIKTVWMLYQTQLPKNRIFSTPEMYNAPNILDYNSMIREDEEKTERLVDEVVDDFDEKIAHQLLEGAKKARTIIPPLSD